MPEFHPVIDYSPHALGTDVAMFSPDRTYRYLLTRTWGNGSVVAWVMLNPSTADAFTDDPTIRRCRAFTRRFLPDAGGLTVVNLYALCATDPAALLNHPDPVGPDADEYLTAPARTGSALATLFIAAWGTGGARNGRGDHAARLLREVGVDLMCLGVTKDGHPRHPLYVRGDAPLVPYAPKGTDGD
jgi:hypothetical protein